MGRSWLAKMFYPSDAMPPSDKVRVLKDINTRQRKILQEEINKLHTLVKEQKQLEGAKHGIK